MKPGRELDVLVAEKVMGQCAGKTIYTSDKELTERFTKEIHDEFVQNYGDEPNTHWLENEVEERVRDAIAGDYPPKRCEKCEHGPHRPIPCYSTSIADAWMVVEKVRKECYPFILTVDRYSCVYSGGKWLASFAVPMDVYECGPLGDDTEAMGYWYNPGLICAGETPAQAICLAALRAYGIDIPRES